MHLKRTHRLTKLTHLRALADPLRLRILQLLIDDSLTTKQVAERLGENVHRLYHHVDALARVGLVRLVETRSKRGTVEKYYRAVARNFTVAHELTRAKPRATGLGRELEASITTVLEAALNETAEHMPAVLVDVQQGRRPLVTRCRIRATRAQIDALRKTLMKCLRQIERLPDRGEEVEYTLTLLFLPRDRSRSRSPIRGRRTRSGGSR